MFDKNQPVARRTRQREAQYLLENSSRKKKMKKAEENKTNSYSKKETTQIGDSGKICQYIDLDTDEEYLGEQSRMSRDIGVDNLTSGKTSRKSDKTSRKSDESSRKSDESSRKSDESSRKSDESSSKSDESSSKSGKSSHNSDESSPNSDESSRKSGKSNSKFDKTSSKSDKTSRKSDKTSRKSDDSSRKSDESSSTSDESSNKSDESSSKFDETSSKSDESSSKSDESSSDADDDGYRDGTSDETSSDDDEDEDNDDPMDEDYCVLKEKHLVKAKEKGKERMVVVVDSSSDSDSEDVRPRRAGRMNKRDEPTRKTKTDDAFMVVLNSIMENTEAPFEETEATPKEERPVKRVLPHKFKWTNGLSIPDSPETPEDPLEPLWKALELGRWSGDIDAQVPNSENEGASIREGKLSTGCDHFLVLDEEIGLRCKYCGFLQTQIHHVVAPFASNPFGKEERRSSDSFEDSLGDDIVFDFQDSGFKVQSPSTISQGTVWDLIPGIKKTLYPHQREGFEFLWNRIAGSTDIKILKDQTGTDRGSGCIISHAPGTGKTRLSIVFLQTFRMLYPNCRPVIVAPRGMLLTWEDEFKKWKVDITFHNLNTSELSGKENKKVLGYLGNRARGANKIKAIRWAKLFSWTRDGGILGISYGLFEKLCGEAHVHEKTKVYKNEDFRRVLLEHPGLFVFDEGHTPRNDSSCMWKALKHIETNKRIILSGTPFQNNFGELFNTLSLAVPSFGEHISATFKADSNMKYRRRKDYGKGEWASITSVKHKCDDDRLTGEQLEKVRNIVSPFVHVHRGNVLQERLPGLKHLVIVLRPTSLQREILEQLGGIKDSFLQDFAVSSVSVHPCLLPEKAELSAYMHKVEKLRLNPDAGVMTRFIMKLLRYTTVFGEKVLIFAQYIKPLALILEQLEKCQRWTQGQEVLYMDGKQDAKQKQSIIRMFNNPTSDAKVLLASIKACSEGISLVGASRVVLLDTTWNPSVERQAVCRAYRLGQKNMVHVYHLVTSGKREEKKFFIQTEKHKMSKSLFCPNDQSSDKTKTEDLILDEMLQDHKLKNIFESICEKNESLMLESFDLVL